MPDTNEEKDVTVNLKNRIDGYLKDKKVLVYLSHPSPGVDEYTLQKTIADKTFVLVKCVNGWDTGRYKIEMTEPLTNNKKIYEFDTLEPDMREIIGALEKRYGVFEEGIKKIQEMVADPTYQAYMAAMLKQQQGKN